MVFHFRQVSGSPGARRPGLPLIFLTGYAQAAALGDAAGHHNVRKPFRPSELAAKIRRVPDAEPAAGRQKGLALRPSPPAQSA